MLVYETDMQVSGGLKIGGWWGFCCCLGFLSHCREACLTSETGEINIQETLVILLVLVQ